MASYTYELQDPNILLSNIRQGLMALGGGWTELAPLMREGHVEYRPKKINPMRSGYHYVYQRAKLDLIIYFPENIFEHLLEWFDREKLEIMKAVVQSSLPKRSGYDVNEFHIRGIIEEEAGA
ncbi:MAG: hypothetical protein IIB46_02735 [Nitrospinae bacterium]|nr:hypothetical protein [Nitrospinota bacterium]